MRIKYSDFAREDLKDILRYGHQHWGASAALDFILRLEKNFELFLQNPLAGRRIENSYLSTDDGEQRAFSFGNYKIIYEVTPDIIMVHGVIPKDRPRL